METLTRRSTVDSTSRMLSVLSVLTALAVGIYVYYQHRAGTPDDQLVGVLDSELAEHANRFTSARQEMSEQFKAVLDKQDKRMEEWNSQLVDAIDTFRQDGAALLDRLEENERLASQQRQEVFRDELSKVAQQSPPEESSGPNTLTGPSNQADSDAAETQPETSDVATNTAGSGDATSDLADPPSAARLKFVNTALRLGSQDPTLILVENEGTEDALIERVRFRPESEFEASASGSAPSAADATEAATIVYQPSDNTSDRAGYHGIYDRRLEPSIRVPAGQSVTLRVVIQDGRYQGWGFAGRLLVEYNQTETLLVNTARVTFRPSEN